MSADGFVCGPNSEMNWMEMNWGDDINNRVRSISQNIDCILLGRKLAEGFIPHWQSVADMADQTDDDNTWISLTPKLVFSRHPQKLAGQPETLSWKNTSIAQLSPQEELTKLKQQNGKDLMVYGGAGFVAELIRLNLIDDYYLFINPAAIGQGMSIFGNLTQNLPLQCKSVERFDCGIVLIHYTKS